METTKLQLKFIAGQTGTIYRWSLGEKLMKCNANILFNKQCLHKNITPSYAKLKIPRTSPAARFTQHKAQILRVKDEIKFLHRKKPDKQRNAESSSTSGKRMGPHMGSDS
jgi:hypothetical protein